MHFFSQNLETLRTGWGLTKTELAKHFGVTVTSYRRWESGTEPTISTLLVIAKYFKVSINELLEKKLEVTDIPPRHGERKVENREPNNNEYALALGEKEMEMMKMKKQLNGEIKALQNAVKLLAKMTPPEKLEGLSIKYGIDLERIIKNK